MMQVFLVPIMAIKMATLHAIARCSKTLFMTHRQRTAVGLALMVAQAFFYNAIFFTYALVLTDFYAVRIDHVGTSYRLRRVMFLALSCSAASLTRSVDDQ